MTPTELDAIFRAWRDFWFMSYPEKAAFRDHYSELQTALWLHDNTKNWELIRAVIHRALDTGAAFRSPADELTIIIPRDYPEPFSFADPPPLPASAPIPFAAGEALLNQALLCSYCLKNESEPGVDYCGSCGEIGWPR